MWARWASNLYYFPLLLYTFFVIEGAFVLNALKFDAFLLFVLQVMAIGRTWEESMQKALRMVSELLNE